MRTTVLLTVGCALFSTGPLAAQPKPDAKGFDFNGRVEATTVEIRPRVTGAVAKIAVKDGATVKAGELLAEIDPRAAKIEVNIARAKLEGAAGKLRVAQTEHARVKVAFDKGVGGKDQFVRAEAELVAAQAEELLAKAELERAELHLSWTRITAPIEGRVGRFNLTEGSLVRADTDTLVTVVRMDPLQVAFDVDENTAIKLRGHLSKGGKLGVAVGFASDEGFPHTAELTFTDAMIDRESGKLWCRATLANPKGEFIPGMFARVRLTPQPAK